MTEPIVGPGQQLRAEREALGVTVREVADTLNLSMTIVQALEADDYGRMPGTVFARGYIRAYARLLDLDPAPLLELFPEQPNGDAQLVVRESGAAEWIRRRPGLVLSLLALFVVALLAGLAALIWPEEGIESLWRPSETPAVTIPPADGGDEWGWTEEGADPARLDAAAGEAAAAETSAAEAPMAAADADGAEPGVPAGSEGSTPPAGVGSAVVEGTPESGSAGAVRRITATGDQRLRLDFSADSWVEIRNPGGTVLYSNLNRAGTGLELVGQGPFRILLGYAPGVTLAFEGEPVALAPHTRNNVATLVLGQ